MTVVLVDGNQCLHRTLHVKELSELKVSGSLIGGVFGVLGTVRIALERYAATKCCVVWDGAQGSAHRKAIYPEYKANRKPKTPQEEAEKQRHYAEFNKQKQILCKILPDMGIRIIEVPAMEGDDVLYAATLVARPQRSVIVTEDKDLLQLVSATTSVFRPAKLEDVSAATAIKKIGIPPQLVPLHKAITGDSSDNVAGIGGTGEVTATAAINEYLGSGGSFDESLKGFIDYCGTHKSKRVAKIASSQEVITRNLQLVDLKKAPWTNALLSQVSCGMTAPIKVDTDRVATNFRALQFNQYLTSFTSWFQPFRCLR